ncbi:MAG: hypothetical protein EOO97_00090 [Pedobacter sp.]|nr:MAG: hypothetical protein EOO97_00090 [Pedobacter sp.]
MKTQYRQDADFSEAQEEALANIYRHLDYEVTISDKSCAHTWDIQVTNPNTHITTKIEVKADRMVYHTQNVAIEFAARDIAQEIPDPNNPRYVSYEYSAEYPTGVSKTDADWLAYTLSGHTGFFLVKTEDVMKVVKDPGTRKVFGGDNGRFKCALIPVDTFKKISRPIPDSLDFLKK